MTGDMKEYDCIVFQNDSPGDLQHNGMFFLHLWEAGSNPPHLKLSIYNNNLEGLLDVLVKSREDMFVRTITTVPARMYIVKMDSEDVPIPDEGLSKFISGYKQRTKNMDYPPS